MILTAPSDGWLFDDVNDLARHTARLHAPMQAYAGYGVILFAGLLLTGWWQSRGRGPRAMAASIWAGAATVLAVALNQPVVALVHETRPYTVLPHALVLAHRSADCSFPSDHAVMAGAATAGLWLVSRRLGVLAAAAAVLLAFSRVYIAAHHPHDVAAGLVLGAVVTLAGWWQLARSLTRMVSRLGATPARPLVTSEPATATAASRR